MVFKVNNKQFQLTVFYFAIFKFGGTLFPKRMPSFYRCQRCVNSQYSYFFETHSLIHRLELILIPPVRNSATHLTQDPNGKWVKNDRKKEIVWDFNLDKGHLISKTN